MESYNSSNTLVPFLSSFNIFFDTFVETDKKPGSLFTSDSKYLITYNLCNNYETFISRLESRFSAYRVAIESKIHVYDSKGGYLIFLTSSLMEIRALRRLIHTEKKDEVTYYFHSKFKFLSTVWNTNVQEEEVEPYFDQISKYDFSDHVFAMKLILDETEFYLEKLISIIQNLLASDLQLSPNTKVSDTISSLSDPLKFFDHLISFHGLNEQKKAFLKDATDEDGYYTPYIKEIAPDGESFTFYDVEEETSTYNVITKIFYDDLKTLVINEFNLSANFIDQLLINQGTNESEIKTLVNRCYNQLIYLHKRVLSDDKYLKYPVIINALNAFESRISGKYSTFIDPKLIESFNPKRCIETPAERLIWNDGSTAFIALFLNLIKNRSISLASSSDLDPIYKKIESFFYVKKKASIKEENEDPTIPYVKGTAVIQYFRKAHSDPK